MKLHTGIEKAVKKQWKSNEQAVEMWNWNVRELCAIVMYPNAQKEWLAGEAPHLEHYRTRSKTNDKTIKKKLQNCKHVKCASSLR